MYERLGYGWGNSVLALINLILCVVPVTLFIVARKSQDNMRVTVNF
jgi:hypothetical protein